MAEIIPDVIDELYSYFVPASTSQFWPDHLAKDPVQAHGLWSFYQGLQLGIRLSQACQD